MRQHHVLALLIIPQPAVADVAVVGVPSEQWGETPVAFVVRRPGTMAMESDLLTWHNERSGKTQRLSALNFLDELPRSGREQPVGIFCIPLAERQQTGAAR